MNSPESPRIDDARNRNVSIGIRTFHEALNYGAMLQATSLVNYLRESLFDAWVLDVRGLPQRVFAPPTSLKAIVKNVLVAPRYRMLKTRIERSQRFMKSHIPLFGRYQGASDLASRWPDMDAFITGSDQVWNTKHNFNPTFFLLPADPRNSRLISYAASFGLSSVPEPNRDRIRDALLRFHAVSVRENTGADIVENLIGKRPPVVCDPVFLHSREYYDGLSLPYPAPARYILVYRIGVNAEGEAAIRHAKEMLKLPVVEFLSGTGRSRSRHTDIGVFDAGPAEFLHLVGHASFICTNSFHGTAFSFIFRKPFLAAPALGGLNTRIESLLEAFGETDRFETGDDREFAAKWDRISEPDIEKWDRAHQAISEAGAIFLHQALAEVRRSGEHESPAARPDEGTNPQPKNS